MLFTDVQRSVRLNKKEKSTNTSPYPDEVIDRLARAFYPAILACWNSEEGQREFAAWQAEQAHHANNEKQKVPTGAFLPAGRKARGTGCSNPPFAAPQNSCKTKRAAPHKVLLLVRPGGFEPLAFRVGAERSIQLSYDRLYMKNAVTAYFNLVKWSISNSGQFVV